MTSSFIEEKRFTYESTAGITVSVTTPVVLGTDAKGNLPKAGKSGKGGRLGFFDDNTFKYHPELVERYPRGLSYFKLGDQEFELRGFPKFTGKSDGDEDTGISCQLLNDDVLAECDQVVITTKSNGKAVYFTLVETEAHGTFILAGSKTVHRAVSLSHFEADLALLDKAPLVQEMIRLIKQAIDKMSDLSFIYQHWLVGEFNDYMHIVPRPEGQANHITWFGAINKCDGKYDICLALQQLKELGLETVDYRVIPSSELDRKSLRQQSGMEGYVLHWRREGITIALEKVKTIWYIFLRATREKLKGRMKFLNNYRYQLHQVLRERNEGFPLYLTDSEMKEWYCHLDRFLHWVRRNTTEAELESAISHDDQEGEGFGQLYATWRRIASATEEVSPVEIPDGPYETLDTSMPERLVVFFQGAPGTGKNTIGLRLAPMWNAPEAGDAGVAGVTGVCIDQDSFKSGKECISCFTREMQRGRKVIYILRCNAEAKQYSSYLDLAIQNGYRTLLLRVGDPHWRHFLMCAQSVLARESHPTFQDHSPETKVKLVGVFCSLLQRPLPSQLDEVSDVNYLYYESSALDNASLVSAIESYLEHCRHHEFSAEPPDPSLMEMIQLEPSLPRRPVDSIVECISRDLSFFTHQDADTPCYTPRFMMHTQPMYISVDPVDPEAFKRLPCEPGVESKDVTAYLHHVTLAHRQILLDQGINAREYWLDLKSQLGREVDIEVTGYCCGDDGTVVYTVSLGWEMNQRVHSKVPHITGYLPKGVPPVASINLLRNNTLVRELWAEPITIKGRVTFH